MRHVWLHEQVIESAFAKEAAEEFSADPGQYSTGTLEPGSFLGLRWGGDNDGVLVVKLDESFEPVNYMGLVAVPQAQRPGDEDEFGSTLMIAFNITRGQTISRKLAIRARPDQHWQVTGFQRPMTTQELMALPGFRYLGSVDLQDDGIEF